MCVYIKHDFETTEPLSSVLYNLLHSLLLIWECFKDILNYPLQNGNNHFKVNSRVRNDYTSTSILFWIVHINSQLRGSCENEMGNFMKTGAGRPGGELSCIYHLCQQIPVGRDIPWASLAESDITGPQEEERFSSCLTTASAKKTAVLWTLCL